MNHQKNERDIDQEKRGVTRIAAHEGTFAAMLEFNVALSVLREYGLFVYCDADGKWRVREVKG